MGIPASSPAGRGIGRRAVLLGAAGVALSACSTTHRASAPTATASRPGSAAPPTRSATTAATPSPLPHTTAWLPGPSEVHPDVKLRAVQLIEAIGAWPPGQRGLFAAGRRVAALGLPSSLAGQAGPLLPDAAEAALQVIDAQYGGILADSASVLVVCRQWTRGGDGSVVAGGTTVDVRLSSASPRWAVTALHPAQPGAAASSLPGDAARALSDARITLPPAAQADLRSGTIHPTVLGAMLSLAGSYRMYISAVRSGHPLDVFGTNRPSDHPLGRAFDVWQINGRAVVDPATPRGLIETFMRDAAAAGSYNVGGPVQLSGGAAADQFFTDDTHHDHVHIGFNS